MSTKKQRNACDQIFKKYGLKLRNRIIWHFGHGLHASNRFSGRYETILWFSKTDDYIFNLDNGEFLRNILVKGILKDQIRDCLPAIHLVKIQVIFGKLW
jgi:hypothetical protein